MELISLRGVAYAIVCLLVVAWADGANAETESRLIPFQGWITDDAGTPLDGLNDIQFAIYESPVSTVSVWSEVHAAVPVANGHFNVILGNRAPLVTTDGEPLAFGSDSPKFLGISVGSGLELVPRHRLFPAFYSHSSGTADIAGSADEAATLTGLTPDDLVMNGQAGFVKFEATNPETGEIEEVNWGTHWTWYWLWLDRLRVRTNTLAAGLDVAAGEICRGRVVKSGNYAVTLSRIDGDEFLLVAVGTKVLKHNDDLTFSLDSNLIDAPGGRASDTFYYLYVQDGGGVMTPYVSTLPPNGRTYPGTGSPAEGARYVGDVLTDGDGYVARVDHNPLTDEYRIQKTDFATGGVELVDLQPTSDFAQLSLESYVPATATAVLLRSKARGLNTEVTFGSASRIDDPPGSGDGFVTQRLHVQQHRVRIYPVLLGGQDFLTNSVRAMDENVYFWLPIDGSDGSSAIAYHYNATNGTPAFVYPHGWRSPR